MLVAQKTIERKFQSTLSMRRATDESGEAGLQIGISIHALHEESDSPPADW